MFLLKSNRYIELYPLLILFFIFFLLPLFVTKRIFFFNSFIFPTLNKKPALPPKRISLGPVGQFEDIIVFFKYCASSNTFGNPSNFEDNIKISA